jgi:hypothetical protein
MILGDPDRAITSGLSTIRELARLLVTRAFLNEGGSTHAFARRFVPKFGSRSFQMLANGRNGCTLAVVLEPKEEILLKRGRK